MPYLPIDLDGRRHCAKVASLLGVHPGVVSWALQEMWDHVWREHFAGRPNPDTLREMVLLGCLGELVVKPRAVEALVEFGFLEVVEGGHRVRGAAKWLFGMEGKSRGGHASKGNLIPGGPRKSRAGQTPKLGLPLGSAETPAETQPIGRPSALTPSTQHPAPILNTPPAANSNQPPLIEKLASAWKAQKGHAYSPTFADEQAGRALLGKGDEDEILRRWEIALQRQRFPLCNSIADLLKHWNAYGTADPLKAAGTSGRASEADKDWSKKQPTTPDGKEIAW